MRGTARSRHGALEYVGARWHRALPLLTATLLLLPGGVAFASEPIAGPTTASLVQSESERRCIVRCNEAEKPKPGARLQAAATKAKTVVQNAREAAGRVKEAAGEAKEAVGEIADASDDPKAALGEVKEGAGEVKEALTTPTEQSEAANAEAANTEPAPEPAPAEAASTEPALAATEPAPAAEPAPAPPVTTAVASAAPAPALQPGLSAQPEVGTQAAAPRADGVAGGPNVAAQRPGTGTLGQGNGTDPVAQADPAPAAPSAPSSTEPAPAAVTPPNVQPDAPIVSQAPPVAPGAAAPAPADASTSSKPSDESDSTIKIAGWSMPVPLAVAGGLLAGLVVAVPVMRRQQRALAPSPVESRALPRHDDSLVTYPDLQIPAPGAAPTLLTRPVRPVGDSIATASHARMNGAPVPYLRPVPNHADERRANVSGAPDPSWSQAATRGRSDRALA